MPSEISLRPSRFASQRRNAPSHSSGMRFPFSSWLRAGIEVYEYRAAFLHSKTMVIDGVWSTVGSTNLDRRSFALNDELNLVIYDRAVARRLDEIFAQDLELSRRVTYEDWRRRGIVSRLLELLAIPIKDQL